MILVVYDLRVSKYFGLKKSHTKIDKNPQRMDTLSSGVIEIFWAQIIIQEKFARFKKVLNYIKSSCIIFCAKIFVYSHYIYHVQEESIHFSLRVLRNFGLEASKHFGHKNYRRKIGKNLQRFLSYTKFPYVPKCFYTSRAYTADTH